MIIPDDLQVSYDAIADEYVRRCYHELEHKPFDREMLDRFAGMVAGHGRVCDLGCGPGQIARYLKDLGLNMSGVDYSEEMVRQARRLNPDITFQQGDMLALTHVPDRSYAGIAAFYSIIHVPQASVLQALQEMHRVMCPDGVLLLTFHVGQEVRHFDELWGTPVSLDFCFFESDEMQGYLTQAGFVIEDVIERDPYPDVEAQTQRAYIFARKPASSIT